MRRGVGDDGKVPRPSTPCREPAAASTRRARAPSVLCRTPPRAPRMPRWPASPLACRTEAASTERRAWGEKGARVKGWAAGAGVGPGCGEGGRLVVGRQPWRAADLEVRLEAHAALGERTVGGGRLRPPGAVDVLGREHAAREGSVPGRVAPGAVLSSALRERSRAPRWPRRRMAPCWVTIRKRKSAAAVLA